MSEIMVIFRLKGQYFFCKIWQSGHTVCHVFDYFSAPLTSRSYTHSQIRAFLSSHFDLLHYNIFCNAITWFLPPPFVKGEHLFPTLV